MIICLCEDISYSALLNIIDNSSSVEEILRSKSMPKNISSLLRAKLDTDYAVKYNDAIRHRRTTLFFNQYSCYPQ